MCNPRHSCRRIDLTCAPVFAGKPRQAANQVGIELARQAGVRSLAEAFGTVASGTCRNIGFGNAVVVNPFSRRNDMLRCPAKGARIDIAKMRGQSHAQFWAHAVYFGHVEKKRPVASALDEGP